MVSNQKLFTVGTFDFRLQHLLIIGVLALSISISMLVRSTPASFGFELFEFDPFFNYRATEYIVNNGYNDYLQWFDDKSWHPFGRNVSTTSQASLHLTTSILYQTFGFNSSLYDFTILFPLVIGSLTSIVVFAFVRVLGGTTAGLLAALMFSISVPIFTRGLIGWFKSEPLGLFFSLIALYLFVSALKFNKGKISFIKIITSGLFISLALSAWGGTIFFVLVLGVFLLALPFFKKENNFLIWLIPSFSLSMYFSSFIFERSYYTLEGYVGLLVLLSTAFVIITEIIKKFSAPKNQIRNCLIFLSGVIISGIVLFFSLLSSYLPTFRYQNAMNPLLTTNDPLTDSVAEHLTTSTNISFMFLSVFIIFAVIGIWMIFSNRNLIKHDMALFALVASIFGIYSSSAFVRLELLASLSVIILGSIGLTILFRKILETRNVPSKFIFFGVIFILFLIPTIYPEEANWISWGEFPPTILNGGVSSKDTSDDWAQAMFWLKNNTSEDAVIAAWWDYGYWITTLSERTTLADNATLIDWQIKKIAYSLITTPENSWKILSSDHTTNVSENLTHEFVDYLGGDEQKDEPPGCIDITAIEANKNGIDTNFCNPIARGMDADYVLIFLSAERIYIPDSPLFFYLLEGGGDESKKQWFVKISNHEITKFVESDGITPTSHFMENSTLGNLIPFSIFKYAEPNTSMVFDEYQHGFIPIYVKDVKYLDPENDPFFLVYASPSFYSEIPGQMHTILIYKINHNYQP